MSQFPLSPYMDFETAVGAGMVTGMSVFTVNGFSENIDTAPDHDLISWADTYVWPPETGDLMEVVSANAGDTSAITVIGLDTDFREKIVTVSLTGLTPVSLGAMAFTRINYAFNSGNTAWLGNVSIRKVAAGQVYAVVLPEYQELQQAVYTIPRGKTGLLRSLIATARRTAGASTWVDCHVNVRQIVGTQKKVWRRPFSSGLEKSGSSSVEFLNRYPNHLPGPFDVLLSAHASDNDTIVGARMAFLLYNNAEAIL